MATRTDSMASRLLGGKNPELEVDMSAVYMVYLTLFIDTIAGSVSTPVMPYYAESFGVGTRAVGYLFSLWSLAATIFAPLLGKLSDKVGRRWVLVVSLFGASISNLVQGVAPNFTVFIAGRFCSGIWAAVGATCNIYLTDVAKTETMRKKLLGTVAMVPMLGVLFGPGIGGGLAKFGLNVPILCDSVVTMFGCFVVFTYLPESPPWLRSKAAQSQESAVEQGQEQTAQQAEQTAKQRVPAIIHFFGLGAFLGGLAFSNVVSLFALFMKQLYDWGTLEVGFGFMSFAIFSTLIQVFLMPALTKHVRVLENSANMCLFGGMLQFIGMVGFAVSPTWLIAMSIFMVNAAGQTFTRANFMNVVSQATTVENRGSCYGWVQFYMNAGRMVGPVLQTHVASITEANFWMRFAFSLGGVYALTSGALFCLSQFLLPKPDEALSETQLKRRTTSAFGEEWRDELGDEEATQRIGKFMAGLLAQRHYRWVSRPEEVEELLAELLPTLEIESKDRYNESLAHIHEMKQSFDVSLDHR